MNPSLERLKIGIMGCGAVADLFYTPALKVIQESGLISVEVLCDPARENADRLAKSFPAAAVAENLSGRKIDLVIVASPPNLHASQTIAALQSGSAVLCEKPMAISADQCREMNACAKSRRRLLAVGLIRRFFPASQLIRQIISNRVLGHVTAFDFSEGAPFSWPAKSESFFDKEQAGGGVLTDLGSHVLDLLIWWFGQPQEEKYQDDAMGGVEANCHLDLKYEEGTHGIVRLSRDCQLANKCFIQFDHGWLRWNLSDINTIELSFDKPGLVLDGAVLKREGKASVCHKVAKPLTLSHTFLAQINNVIASMAGNEKLLASGEEAAKSIEFIERCYGKRTLIDMPWLSAKERVRAQSLGSADSTC